MPWCSSTYAAKAFLQFMLEKEQYEPWLNANSGYWSQPLAAYADAAVWSGDPKVKIFKDTMNSTYYEQACDPARLPDRDARW